MKASAIEIERALKKLIYQQQQFGIELMMHPDLDHYLNLGTRIISANWLKKPICR